MTEDEAMTKWCPMVRHTAANNEVYQTNRGEHPDMVNCIASGCMMWQWHTGQGNTPWMQKKSQAKVDAKPDNERSGYCGLGGNHG